jgi:plastocyanin
MTKTASMFLLALAGIFVVCAAVPASATVWQVIMNDQDQFSPDSLSIAVGDSVYWTNEDEDEHTATSGVDCTEDGLFDSGDLEAGESWGRVFDVVGVFPYFCEYHCFMGMTGSITVNAANPVDASTWGKIKALYR